MVDPPVWLVSKGKLKGKHPVGFHAARVLPKTHAVIYLSFCRSSVCENSPPPPKAKYDVIYVHS